MTRLEGKNWFFLVAVSENQEVNLVKGHSSDEFDWDSRPKKKQKKKSKKIIIKQEKVILKSEARLSNFTFTYSKSWFDYRSTCIWPKSDTKLTPLSDRSLLD